MTSWKTDVQKASRMTEYSLIDHYVNWVIDCNMWTFMQMWSAPFQLPGNLGEIEKWTNMVSLNGIKSTNICRPD